MMHPSALLANTEHEKVMWHEQMGAANAYMLCAINLMLAPSRDQGNRPTKRLSCTPP